MTGVVGDLACGFRPVESPPFSIRKEGKWVARGRKAPTKSKVPKPQVPTRLTHILSAPECFLGWLLPTSPLLHLLLCFLVVLSLRCHFPAASNRHSKPPQPSTCLIICRIRTLDIPKYTPSRTRCNTPFLVVLRSFSHKNPHPGCTSSALP